MKTGMYQTASEMIREALKLLEERQGREAQCRAQFFGFAARLIRNILVDHARNRGRLKRGGTQVLTSLEDLLRRDHRHHRR